MVAGGLVVPVSAGGAAAHPEGEVDTFSALVFSRTAEFRHDSIEAGVAAIEQLGTDHGFTVDHTEDPTAFTAANLADYDVVVWLSTTGDVLNDAQQAAFEDYIQAGGGYAGIHAASDTEYDWPWYGDLVGAYFEGHPPGTPDATVVVEDLAHPSTHDLPARWDRTDEWYSFQDNPRGDVHVLASLDESTYSPGGTAMGEDHPIAWCQDYDGGRAWYTGGGHTAAAFAEPDFLNHVLEGIRTAAGVVPADCGATLDESFAKVTLDDDTQNPMDLAPAPDGRTFYIERDGRVQVVSASGGTTTAGQLAVTTVQEFGLLGIELDPDFAENGWIYLYYSPAGSSSDRVSRFTVTGSTMDLASEQVLLEIPVQRAECCHAGGALQFDGQGNLYIATGDNTNPFASDGYSPIDERDGRAYWDAQRTSGNTNSLSGKVLRITPQDDGTYTVPEGNLFAPGTELTQPEIYAMGFRNPFKIGLDPRTGTLLVADYGPDAGSANPARGPAATVEWNIVAEPGNYGWPYCVGPNSAYVEYDFATATSGEAYDCAGGPTNDSPNNTGLTQLPPAIPATIWYQNNGALTNAPEIGGGGAPMAGGVYVYDEASTSKVKWPAYWDGKAIFGEWNTNQLFSFQLTDDSTEVVDINRVLATMSFTRPHALEWGADGALYVIEWGAGFGGNNADSGLYRIDYIAGSRAPIVQLGADVTSGPAPLTVQFDSAGSRDPDGTDVTFAWDFGDGQTSTEAAPSHTYTTAGDFTATLTVTDGDGEIASSTQTITVGNTAPTITVEEPPNGGFFTFGDVIDYRVTVTDPEDGEIDCQDVVVQPALGHDEHAHPYDQYLGCEGSIPVNGDTGHIGADIFGIITVTYTDQGGEGGSSPLTTQEIIVLQPKHKEAEYFTATGRLEGSTSTGDAGVQLETTSDVGGGQNVAYAETGDWFSFEPVDLTGIDSVRVRAASQPGGTIELRTGSPDGPVIGSAVVPADDWQAWGDYVIELADDVTTGGGPLYVVMAAGQVNVNWLEFQGQGVTDNAAPVVEVSATPTSGTVPLVVDLAATATDLDGDTPLTYTWTLGDGTSATGATTTHTYTTPGTYTATVNVTDARGASASRAVQIEVTAAELMCFAGRSDGFAGDALDTDRWTTVVRPNQDLRVEDGALVIPTSATDIYSTGTGTTPNIVLQDLPAGPFTATAKLTLPGSEAYQQAGLVIYGDDDNYAKMVFSGRSTSGPDPATRVFQFIREEAGTPNEVAASNSPALGADYPSTVWVRFTSDGSNLVASYSADGTTFTEMTETKSLAGITNPKIGLMALQGNGRTQAPVEAQFDWFTFTPDDTAGEVGADDEFDGSSIDGCRWDVVNPDPSLASVADGALRLTTTGADVYQTGNSTVPNILRSTQVTGDSWTVETKVDVTLESTYQQAGLIVFGDDDNYVKLDPVFGGGDYPVRIELRSEVDAVVTAAGEDLLPEALDYGTYYLRLTRDGDTFTGSYSPDGETWTALAGSVTNDRLDGVGPGPYALGANQQAPTTAAFDWFRLVDDVPVDDVAPVVEVTVDPAAPTGENGWYTGAVQVTATATDESAGDVVTEHRVGDGEWLPYTAPVTVSEDGTHVVAFRATDAAGNVSEPQSVEVRIDTAGPEVTLTGVADGDDVEEGTAFEVSAAATDTGSGVGTVVLTLDGEEVGNPSTLEPAVGTHELVATATDVAGNTTDVTVTFEVTDDGGTTAPEFVDVGPGQVFYDEIRWLADNGITTGYVIDGQRWFRPTEVTSRQAMAAFLYRYAGEGWTVPDDRQSFTDVPAGHPFYTEIEWLHEVGMAEGYADGTFGGALPVSRQAMVAFLYRWAAPEGYEPSGGPSFSDVGESATFYEEIEWAAEVGLTTGYVDGTFRPTAGTSRQAVAAFFVRVDALTQD